MDIRETDRLSAAMAKAPRVSLAEIERKIATRLDGNLGQLFGGAGSPALDTVSLCVLIMQNGFVEIGHSAPASPQNFNADLGTELAYQNALRKLWPLEGYLLRERLHLG